ncbi:hypothetical protein BOQ00_03880 [Campylobacter coli]|nr:hypothetical protein BOQ00_03880 [Campylobacter coli]
MNLNFKFKGNRNYIQGPDICNQIFSLYKEDFYKDFEISFHSLAHNNIVLSQEQLKQQDQLKFVCKFKQLDNTIKTCYGYENILSKPNTSYAYNEEEITDYAIIDLQEKSIVLKQHSVFTPLEEIVALNKHLVSNLFKEQTGKWYFTKLQLKKPFPKDIKIIKILLKNNFNFLMVKSEIYIENEFYGNIYFSLK